MKEILINKDLMQALRSSHKNSLVVAETEQYMTNIESTRLTVSNLFKIYHQKNGKENAKEWEF